MAESKWRSAIHAVLRHPDEKKILLIPDHDGWRLPVAVHEAKLWVAEAEIAVAAVSKALDTEAWLLRQLQYQVLNETSETTAAYEFELIDRNWDQPDGARWVALEEFENLTFRPENLQKIVLAYLENLESEAIPVARPPWSFPGWHAQVHPWIKARLAEHGVALAKMEQVKHWGISTVIRLKTDRDHFYFKAPQTSQPLFANETRVTRQLAELFPGRVPRPLASEIERDWMIFRDFGKANTWEVPLEDRLKMYRQFAQLQIESIPRIEALLKAGCMDRRLAVLANQVDPLLESPAAVGRMAPDKRKTLQNLAFTLKTLCRRLADFGLPDTLVHGDLHPGNTFIRDEHFVFYDWTDACIAHPFMDLSSTHFEEDERVVSRIVRAYLEPWQDFEPMERLLEMWSIARILMMLHQAVSYDSIVRNLEPDSRKGLDFSYKILEDLPAAVQAISEGVI